MPAAGTVWALMGAEVSCSISSIQAAERRAGRGSVGRARGSQQTQTRVAQATAPCRRRDDLGVRTLVRTEDCLLYRVGAVGGGELRLGEVPTA
eukprot:scaffold5545_cov111-Isochrysis_galbana.AAC.12